MTTVISEDELERQQPYKEQVFQFYAELKHNVQPLACVRTFGCQQNVSDSEHIKGMLAEMGFAFTEEPEEADLILFNTCAVREHASDRVFGNVGALKHIKARHPHVLIAVCGCMVQQPHVAEKFKESYPFVGLVFGTHVIHRLPELLWEALHSGRQLSVTPQQDGVIAEGIRTHRDGTFKAWLPIMYGCNNFCTYCVVPYVRGRERSRKPEDILAEAKELIAAGYKEITLLGQNVNSYGKGESHGVTFAGLLCGLLGVAMAIYVLVSLISGRSVAGWASIMMSIWLLGGLQLTALGLIGEYIGKIYMETKRRPKFILEETLGDDQ